MKQPRKQFFVQLVLKYIMDSEDKR